MGEELAKQFMTAANVVRQFKLSSLAQALQACEALLQADSLLDVAVLGQFKSGKSSLLNALLGETVVADPLLGAEQADRVRHGFVDECSKGGSANIIDDADNDVALASDSANNDGFARGVPPGLPSRRS